MSKKIKILTPRIYEHGDFFHKAVDFAREHSLNTNELCLELSHYLVDNFDKVWKIEKPCVYKKIADLEAKLAESEEKYKKAYIEGLLQKQFDKDMEIEQLKQQLAEKEKEIEKLKERLNKKKKPYVRLLPCTCGGKKRSLWTVWTDEYDTNQWYYKCLKCGAKGYYAKSAEKAKVAWNDMIIGKTESDNNLS